MKTDLQSQPTKAVFLQTIAVAVAQLKQRLQHDYEQAYPNLSEVIRLVLDEEETKAWELTRFPHLLFPDLVDAHIATLNLQPAKANHRDIFAISRFSPIPRYKPAAAFCG
jgi:hypothetical protein